MLAGVSSMQITSPSQLNADVVETAAIAPGAIINSDINAAAAIDYSKLNSAAVNVDVIPATDNTRVLGTGPKRWYYITCNYLGFSWFTAKIAPNLNNTFDIGDTTHIVKTIYVNDILGDARGAIAVFGRQG